MDSSDRSIPWYKKAETVCKTFSAKTQREKGVHHNVYLILLEGVDNKKPGYAIYVGLTGLTPEERFQRHKNGEQASRIVEAYGKRILPGLYAHLNPMSWEEARELESDIFEALIEAGIPAHGGH